MCQLNCRADRIFSFTAAFPFLFFFITFFTFSVCTCVYAFALATSCGRFVTYLHIAQQHCIQFVASQYTSSFALISVCVYSYVCVCVCMQVCARVSYFVCHKTQAVEHPYAVSMTNLAGVTTQR